MNHNLFIGRFGGVFVKTGLPLVVAASGQWSKSPTSGTSSASCPLWRIWVFSDLPCGLPDTTVRSGADGVVCLPGVDYQIEALFLRRFPVTIPGTQPGFRIRSYQIILIFRQLTERLRLGTGIRRHSISDSGLSADSQDSKDIGRCSWILSQ